MTSVQRHATTVWDGDLIRGKGRVNGASGALAGLPVTYKSRIGTPDGRTSPEEPIAPAHFVVFFHGFGQPAFGKLIVRVAD